MRRGEVWWAHVDKRRPVVLVSRAEAYTVRTLVTIAPVTTTLRGYAVEVKLGRREGLGKPCVVNCDSLLTIPKAALESRIGALSAAKLVQLDDALRFALDLDTPR
jgi:mRNA interferase MazF